MIPMRERRHDEALEVRDDLLEGFATFGRRGWERVAQLSGGDAREDRIAI
jgi:hypothetical protein